TDVNSGLIDYTGPVIYDLSNVVNLPRTTVRVAGAGRSVTFAKVTDIDDASFYVAGGARLSLPGATSYIHVTTANGRDRHFQAAGANSVLDLSAVNSITNGTDYGSHVSVDALAGGLIDL